MKKIIAYTDGDARGNPGPSGIGVHIIDADGKVLKEVSEFIGNSTSHFAEYQGVMVGLQTLTAMFGKATKEMEFELRMNSELVKKQLNSEDQINEPGLVPMFIEIHNMRVASFPNLILAQVKSELNQEAGRLANDAIDDKE